MGRIRVVTGATVIALLLVACAGAGSADAAGPSRSVTIVGHVRDASGAPIVGVVVGAGYQSQGGEQLYDRDSTDANGAYHLRVLATDTVMSFATWGSGWVPASKAPFVARAGHEYRVDRTLARSTTVTGRISVAGAAREVAVVPIDASSGRALDDTLFRAGTTDAEGRYTLTAPAGTYRLQVVDRRTQATDWLAGGAPVDAASGATSVQDGDFIEIAGPMYTPSVTATAAPDAATSIVGGTVRLPSGAIGAHAGILVQHLNTDGTRIIRTTGTHADAAGRFHVRLAPGRYALYISTADGGAVYSWQFDRVSLTVARGTRYHVASIVPMASQISGTVRDPSGAVRRGKVVATDAVTGSTISTTPTNREGNYHLILPAGSYTLRFTYLTSDVSTWLGGAPTRLTSPVVTVVAGGKTSGWDALLPGR